MEDLAAEVKAGNLNFDVVIATPILCGLSGQLGQVLGPRGLMPNPRLGTVTQDVAEAVKNAKAGQVRYRTDKNGIIHGGVGQVGLTQKPSSRTSKHCFADLKKGQAGISKGCVRKESDIVNDDGRGYCDRSSVLRGLVSIKFNLWSGWPTVIARQRP
jgi:large subunit ribosomal protein L1